MKLKTSISSFCLEANRHICKLGYKFGRGLWRYQISPPANYNKLQQSCDFHHFLT